jgi:tetratricopeptide (TPR) repeat protein
MRVRAFLVVLLTIFVWSYFVTSASAEQPGDASYDERITAVRQLIKARNLDGAIAMLEVMHETLPDDQLVTNLLRNCYEESANWGKAELLARQLVGRSPDNLIWELYLAESLAKQKSTDSAVAHYRRAYQLAAPADSGRLYGIFQSMMAFGAHVGALDLVDSVRAKSGNKRAFGLQRAMMLQLDRRYAESAREFFSVVSEDTTYAAGDAERQLLSLLAYPEATDEVEGVLNAVPGQVGSGRALRLLMTNAIRLGNYERALTFALRQDSLGTETVPGTALADYVRQCFDRKAYEAAVKGAEYALSRYSTGPFVAQLRFNHADALSNLGRVEPALATYQHIIATSPNPADKSDAYCGIGELYLEQNNDPRRASVYFDSVRALPSRGAAYLSAVRLSPMCDIRAGDYDKAVQNLRGIINAQFSDDIMEEAEFRLALLDLFAHRFDSSKAALKKLMVSHPRGLYVNDAMQLTIDMDQVLPDTTLLVMYARAVESETRRMTDSARQAYGMLADAADQKLADVALYRIAKLELTQSDTSAALRALDALTERFSESFYRPYGLKLKADLIVERPSERDKARLIYRELLEKYPNSPFVSDARSRLRALEQEGRVG